jgi:hypothetical protein
MSKEIIDVISTTIKDSISRFFNGKDVKTVHFLDELFPRERRIRSLIGGLETSLGTQLWEPLANAFAKHNGFTIKDVKVFNSRVPILPKEVVNLIATWMQKKDANPKLTHISFVNELKEVLTKEQYKELNYQQIPKGEGIDIWISKNGVEYIYDIKTNQINAGGGPKFNHNILNWYAYRLLMDPSVNIKCQLAFPFNPHKTDFWAKEGGKIAPLIPKIEAVVGDEFWDFLLGESNTEKLIFDSFKTIGEEGFADQFSHIFHLKIEQ